MALALRYFDVYYYSAITHVYDDVSKWVPPAGKLLDSGCEMSSSPPSTSGLSRIHSVESDDTGFHDVTGATGEPSITVSQSWTTYDVSPKFM